MQKFVGLFFMCTGVFFLGFSVYNFSLNGLNYGTCASFLNGIYQLFGGNYLYKSGK